MYVVLEGESRRLLHNQACTILNLDLRCLPLRMLVMIWCSRGGLLWGLSPPSVWRTNFGLGLCARAYVPTYNGAYSLCTWPRLMYIFLSLEFIGQRQHLENFGTHHHIYLLSILIFAVVIDDRPLNLITIRRCDFLNQVGRWILYDTDVCLIFYLVPSSLHERAVQGLVIIKQDKILFD